MTPQEVFDTVVAALVKQGRKSLAENGDPSISKDCRYRGDDGLKCAIGHLIPDDEYAEWMEGMGTTTLLLELESRDMRGLSIYALIDEHNDMLGNLQECHDTSDDEDFVAEFLDAARREATHFHLDWNFTNTPRCTCKDADPAGEEPRVVLTPMKRDADGDTICDEGADPDFYDVEVLQDMPGGAIEILAEMSDITDYYDACEAASLLAMHYGFGADGYEEVRG